MSELDAVLEKGQADGTLTVEDADTIRDFGAFLAKPASRCAICLNDDAEDASWRNHPKLGSIFICRVCTGGRR